LGNKQDNFCYTGLPQVKYRKKLFLGLLFWLALCVVRCR